MDDDEIDDLFSFGPNTTTTTSSEQEKPDLDDELSELLQVKTSKTKVTDDDDVFGSFQQNDESTRDILDWLDAGGTKSSSEKEDAKESSVLAEKEIEQEVNDTTNDTVESPPSPLKEEKDTESFDFDEFEITPTKPTDRKKADTTSFDFEKDILGDEEDAKDVLDTPTIAKIPEITEDPIKEENVNYSTFSEALQNSKSLDVIRTFYQENHMFNEEERKLLWCKFICNNGSMTISDLENSNIADAYSSWSPQDTLSEEVTLFIAKDVSLYNEQNFQNILTYYYQNNTNYDKHVSSIVSTLLRAGFNDKCTITLLLQHIYPNYIPLMALEQSERKDALKVLHTQFYLVCTYHLPLAVIHLDRYVTDWYLRDEFNHWFLCLFASIDTNIELWDRLLIGINDKNDHSMLFFFGLAILNAHSESLLVLTDKSSLEEKLSSIFHLQTDLDLQSIQEDAISFRNQTPNTILSKLKTIEKDVLTSQLIKRTKKTERKSKLQLEIRPKLLAFYEKYNPEKINKVDDVLELFDGRYDELDAKLRNKYGGLGLYDMVLTGESSSRLNVTSKLFSGIRKPQETKQEAVVDTTSQVCVSIKSQEVFPILLSNNVKEDSMKFILADCRLETSTKTQGRFASSISMPPDALNSSELDTFESMRGAVHIVIMGEGYSYLPTVYKDYKIADRALEEDDASRTSLCALYFIKKGFPFVSILDGGFVAAYVYLARAPQFLTKLPSLLMDYDPNASLVAQLEAAYIEECRYKSASAKEKTVMKLQNFMDSSMVRLTVTQQRIESFAVEESGKKRDVLKYFKKAENGEDGGEKATSKLSRIFKASDKPASDDKEDHTTTRFWKRNIPQTSNDSDTVSTDSTNNPAEQTRMIRLRNIFSKEDTNEAVDNPDASDSADHPTEPRMARLRNIFTKDIHENDATALHSPPQATQDTTKFWKTRNPFKADKVDIANDANDLTLQSNDEKEPESSEKATKQPESSEGAKQSSDITASRFTWKARTLFKDTTNTDTEQKQPQEQSEEQSDPTASRFTWKPKIFTKEATNEPTQATTSEATTIRNFSKLFSTTTKKHEYSEPEECISFPDEEDDFVNNSPKYSTDATLFQENNEIKEASLFPVVSNTTALFPVVPKDDFLGNIGGDLIDDTKDASSVSSDTLDGDDTVENSALFPVVSKDEFSSNTGGDLIDDTKDASVVSTDCDDTANAAKPTDNNATLAADDTNEKTTATIKTDAD